MIKAVLFRKQGSLRGFEISGHAESGPYGHDLVCAAVSAVSIGTVHAVAKLCGFEPEIKQRGDGGYLAVTIPDHITGPNREKAEVLLEGMQVSLQSIEQEYHQYITLFYE